MAYTSDKKPGALIAATVLADGDNVVVEQSGDVKKATLTQVEAKVFAAKSALTTPSGTEVTIVRQTDGNLRQVPLANIIPALNITNAQISESAAIADTKLATISTAGKVLNSATTATPDNDINTIVARDGSGNFSAGTITATLAGSITGNAATATTLATGRTIALTGDVTGTTGTFNGSVDVSAATTIANNAVITAKIADANVTNTKLASGIDASKLTTGTLPIARIADGAVTNAKLASGIDASKLTTGTLPIARIADGAVTLAKLVAAVQQALVPAGAVQAFAMNSAPTGWLAADGSDVSRVTYADLFTAIGTTYGAGDGSTTFALPNLQGIFVRGSGGPHTINGKAYSGTFGEKQADDFGSHAHTGTTGNDFPDHAHTFNDYYQRTDRTLSVGAQGLEQNSGGARNIPTSIVEVGLTTPNGTFGANTRHQHAFTTAPTGGTETRPANIAMLYCIKF